MKPSLDKHPAIVALRAALPTLAGWWVRVQYWASTVAGLLALAYIAGTLAGRWHQLQAIGGLWQSMSAGFAAGVLVGVVLLGTANLWLEVRKWKLVADNIGLPQGNRVSQVLAGNSFSMFMPYRTGDYLGRIGWMEANHRPAAIAGAVTSNMMQLLCTLVAGALALSVPTSLAMPNYAIAMVLVALGAIGAILLTVFGSDRLAHFIYRFMPRLKALKSYQLSFGSKANLFGLSALRYFAFSLQMWLLLGLFSDSGWTAGLYAAVAVFFLFQTISFGNLFADLSLRGAVACFVLAWAGVDCVPALAASFLVYGLNVMLPAAAGAVVLITKGERR